MDDKYIEAVKKCSINPVSETDKSLKIVYTPLHGSGITLVPRLLEELGLKMYTLFLNKKSQTQVSQQ